MATPRQIVAARIAQDNPTWRVLDYPEIPANVAKNKPVVSVWRSDVKPGDSRRFLGHDVQVNVYGAKTAGAAAEDELDELLDGVMISLERLGGFTFAAAARKSFGNDSIAGWEITGSVQSANVYRTTKLTEKETTP